MQYELLNDEIPEFPKGPTVIERCYPGVEVSPVYYAYWYFAAERQKVFLNRLYGGNRKRASIDPVLRQFKFTNSYRASDRVSQFLIRDVIYNDAYSANRTDVFLRILLFKIFNKIETWQNIQKEFGEISTTNFPVNEISKLLTGLKMAGETIYSAAYIMPSGKSYFGRKLKSDNHLQLLAKMLDENLCETIAGSNSFEGVIGQLKRQPSLGPFLAYQFAIDLNYSNVIDFSESEFVLPGPGALDGISKCFYKTGGRSPSEMIRIVQEIQEEEFANLKIDFDTLWGRELQLIDCQNLFCETSKYSRKSHPGIVGLSGRTRIKQSYRSAGPIPRPWYPPKWEINEQIIISE